MAATEGNSNWFVSCTAQEEVGDGEELSLKNRHIWVFWVPSVNRETFLFFPLYIQNWWMWISMYLSVVTHSAARIPGYSSGSSVCAERGSGLGLCGLWGHLDLVSFRVLLLTLWESQPPCHLQAESCYHYIICFSTFPGHDDTIFQIRGWQSSALSSLCAVWSPVAGAHSSTWKARKVPSASDL